MHTTVRLLCCSKVVCFCLVPINNVGFWVSIVLEKLPIMLWFRFLVVGFVENIWVGFIWKITRQKIYSTMEFIFKFSYLWKIVVTNQIWWFHVTNPFNFSCGILVCLNGNRTPTQKPISAMETTNNNSNHQKLPNKPRNHYTNKYWTATLEFVIRKLKNDSKKCA